MNSWNWSQGEEKKISFCVISSSIHFRFQLLPQTQLWREQAKQHIKKCMSDRWFRLAACWLMLHRAPILRDHFTYDSLTTICLASFVSFVARKNVKKWSHAMLENIPRATDWDIFFYNANNSIVLHHAVNAKEFSQQKKTNLTNISHII
jgi:hypothetical protein